MIKEKLLENIVCPRCHHHLTSSSINEKYKLICPICKEVYLIAHNRIYMIKNQRKGFDEFSRDNIISKLKMFFKRYPKIFNLVYYFFGASFVGKSAKTVLKKIGYDKLVINLGSSIKVIRKDVINIDFYPFENVDVVADICRLPFRDNSVDMVINEFVIEHTKHPDEIVSEIYRVLRPNGLIYIAAPFVASFHSSPNDYYRWSKEGLKELLKDFKEEEIRIRCGPTSALLSVTNEWLAILFSFGSKKLQQILLVFFMIITSPLKIIDYLIYRLPNAENIAYGFYYIGRKKE